MADAEIKHAMHRFQEAMAALAEVRHSLAVGLDDALEVMNEQLIALETGRAPVMTDPRRRLRALRIAAAGRS